MLLDTDTRRCRHRDYTRGYEEGQKGQRFCPPDFRTDASANAAYKDGYRDGKSQVAAEREMWGRR